MPFAVKKAESAAEVRKFILLPWSLYREDPCWVPPLIRERKNFLDRETNPFFEHAEVDLYLAVGENGDPVGRLAFILDHRHNEYHKEKVGFFGMYESIDDQEVADLLLHTALEQCRARGLTRLLGPMNLSTNHECGLLVDGFDTPPMMGIPYNPPYYPDLFRRWGLVKAKDLISLQLTPKEIPEYLQRTMARLNKRNRFTLRSLRMKRFREELDILWDIYNSGWSENWGFVPMTRKEFEFTVEGMKPIVHPEWCLIAEIDNQPVGFSLTLPNVNQILKPLNGRLFPLGWLKIFLNKNKIDTWRVLTLGVKKKFQRMGIDVALYHETYRLLIQHKAKMVEMSWVLEDNQRMLGPLYRIGAAVYKRHRIYERIC